MNLMNVQLLASILEYFLKVQDHGSERSAMFMAHSNIFSCLYRIDKPETFDTEDTPIGEWLQRTKNNEYAQQQEMPFLYVEIVDETSDDHHLELIATLEKVTIKGFHCDKE